MKIYVKLLLARIELLQSELEGYKKWENELNSEGLKPRNERDQVDRMKELSSGRVARRTGPKVEISNPKLKITHKTTVGVTALGGLASAASRIRSDTKSVKHPSIDPIELEQALIDLYFNLPSPPPELITKLLLILNAPLSKIKPDNLLNVVKHERSKELLQGPVTKLLEQISRREVYLQARIGHLEKELQDLVTLRLEKTSIERNLPKVMPINSERETAILKLLENIYCKLCDLEWKEESVASFLHNLEGDLQTSIQALRLVN